MTAQPYRQVQWLTSDYDFRVHAFYHVDDSQGYLEALCTHSVPPEKIVRPGETSLTPPPCATCLLMHGDDLATHLERWID